MAIVKEIVLGRCDVIICQASDTPDGVEDQVLIIDAQGQKACIGQPLGQDDAGKSYYNDDDRLLARIRVAHPDGVEILVEALRYAAEQVLR